MGVDGGGLHKTTPPQFVSGGCEVVHGEQKKIWVLNAGKAAGQKKKAPRKRMIDIGRLPAFRSTSKKPHRAPYCIATV
jgi:hypothetical protein